MRIFHPRPQPGRQKFIGVEFRDGVAEVDELHPERRLALTMHGYAIEDADGGVTIPAGWAGALPNIATADADAVELPAPLPLRDLSVAELREIARFEGVDLPNRAKKADIIAALNAQHEEHAATSADIAALEEWATDLEASAQADED